MAKAWATYPGLKSPLTLPEIRMDRIYGLALERSDGTSLLGQPTRITTPEAVGTGDGTTTRFELDWPGVVSSTLIVKVDGTPTTAYTLYPGTGTNGVDEIDMTSAPALGKAVTATYTYQGMQNLWRAARAAEDFYESTTGIGLRRYNVRTDPLPAESGTYDIEELGYDYGIEMFRGNAWGAIRLRRLPVYSISSMQICYPNRTSPVYTIPSDWIKLDKRHGYVRIIPSSVAAFAAFSAQILTIMAGATLVPQAIQVAYTAGLSSDEMREEWSQLLDALRMRSVVTAIQLAGLMLWQRGSSLSVSADGLSQSRSGGDQVFRSAVEAYQKQEQDLREAVCNAIRGPNLTFL